VKYDENGKRIWVGFSENSLPKDKKIVKKSFSAGKDPPGFQRYSIGKELKNHG
jgi:hypothetical protein